MTTSAALSWPAQIPALSVELRSTLRRRVPLLASYHEDLVADTLSAVALWVRDHPTSVSEVRSAIAATILSRRIADLFRGRVLSLLGTKDLSDIPQVEPRTELPDGEHKLDVVRLFRVTAELMEGLPREDADLIALATQGALSDKQRQRLHRLRLRLSQQIQRVLGVTPREILGHG